MAATTAIQCQTSENFIQVPGPQVELLVNGVVFFADQKALSDHSAYFRRFFSARPNAERPRQQYRLDDDHLDLAIFRDLLRAIRSILVEKDIPDPPIDFLREKFISMVYKFEVHGLKHICEYAIINADAPVVYKFRMAHTYSMDRVQDHLGSALMWRNIQDSWLMNIQEYLAMDREQRQAFKHWYYFQSYVQDPYHTLISQVRTFAQLFQFEMDVLPDDVALRMRVIQYTFVLMFFFILYSRPITTVLGMVLLAQLIVTKRRDFVYLLRAMFWGLNLPLIICETFLLYLLIWCALWFPHGVLVALVYVTARLHQVTLVVQRVRRIFFANNNEWRKSIQVIVGELIPVVIKWFKRIRLFIRRIENFVPSTIVTIYVNGVAVQANKKHLSAKSNFFKEQLEQLRRGQIPRIEINDPTVDVWHFRSMIWAAIRRYKPKYHELERVIELGHQFNVPAAVDACACVLGNDADLPVLFCLRMAIRFKFFTLTSYFTRRLYPKSIRRDFIRNANHYEQMNDEVRDLVAEHCRNWWVSGLTMRG